MESDANNFSNTFILQVAGSSDKNCHLVLSFSMTASGEGRSLSLSIWHGFWSPGKPKFLHMRANQAVGRSGLLIFLPVKGDYLMGLSVRPSWRPSNPL